MVLVRRRRPFRTAMILIIVRVAELESALIPNGKIDDARGISRSLTKIPLEGNTGHIPTTGVP